MSASLPDRNADIQQLMDNNQVGGSLYEITRFLQRRNPKARNFFIGQLRRVSPDQILGLKPGEILVHNIANLCVLMMAIATMRVAINVVGVEHIIVCGHYGCAGVATAMQAEPIGGLVGEWLAPVQKFWSEHKPDSSAQEEEQKDYYCQLNARRQALSVCQSVPVQQAWQSGRSLQVHAWVYQLADGRVQELGSASGTDAETGLGLPRI